MDKPLVVSIPHHLGKQEALARLKGGLDRTAAAVAPVMTVNEQRWDGDRLYFRVSALQQQASGTVDVADDHVTINVTLPWLLARLATNLQDVIAKRGALLLEKKK
jgi:hypothetical protein